jgi:hypothetical protein
LFREAVLDAVGGKAPKLAQQAALGEDSVQPICFPLSIPNAAILRVDFGNGFCGF